MWLYLFKRLLAMAPTLLGVLTLTFVVTQFVPGGPVDSALLRIDQENSRAGEEGGVSSGGWNYTGRKGIDEKQVEQLSALYGFDKPVLERYGTMLKNFLKFDLGTSYFRQQEV